MKPSGVVTLPLLRLEELAKTDAASAALLERIRRDVLPTTAADAGDPLDTNTLASRIVPSRAADGGLDDEQDAQGPEGASRRRCP